MILFCPLRHQTPRPPPGGPGSMCAAMRRSGVRTRRRLCSATRANRSGDHPVGHLRGFAGILQADAYAGCRRLHEPGRSPEPVTEALCWTQVLRARRHRCEQAARQARAADLAGGAGGGDADRCAVRHRARDQRRACRATPRGSRKNLESVLLQKCSQNAAGTQPK